MVGSTVGSRWQVLVLYGTVARVVSAAATVRVLMRGIGAASCPMRVPYRTVAVSRYCRTCYSYSCVAFIPC